MEERLFPWHVTGAEGPIRLQLGYMICGLLNSLVVLATFAPLLLLIWVLFA